MLAENIMDDAWPGFQGREWGVRAGRFVCPKEFLGVTARVLSGSTLLTFLWKT